MNEQQGILTGRKSLIAFVALCILIAASISHAQQPLSSATPSTSSPGQSVAPKPAKPESDSASKPEIVITPDRRRNCLVLSMNSSTSAPGNRFPNQERRQTEAHHPQRRRELFE